MYLNPVSVKQNAGYVAGDNQRPRAPSSGVDAGHSDAPQEESFHRSNGAGEHSVHASGPPPIPQRITPYDNKGKGYIEGEDTEEAPKISTDKQRPDNEPVSEEEMRVLRLLKRRDGQVRAHEQAHMAAGAGLVMGGPHYIYRRGPDGNLYAVGGDVKIDASEAGTPEKTIMKMQRVKAAALAPAGPSSQDRRVAARAASKAARARMELASQRAKEGTQGVSSAKHKQGVAAYRAFQNRGPAPVNNIGNLISGAT
ncbi:MAG: hypothetical protein HWN68_18980 [Desulfobacterales bacterium]|nr:hypothetical protein [Desulfobacterales bacterium]